MKLIADIGATNARFATLEDGNVANVDILPCAEYASLKDAVESYIQKIEKHPTHAVLAMATPVDGTDKVVMTNHNWEFSIQQTAQALGLEELRIINDFEAVGHAIKFLEEGDYYQVGEGQAVPNMPIGILGPGTGLGVSGIVFDEDGKQVILATEGGHVTMPATNHRELDIFEYIKKTKGYHHLSAERVTSGKGIVNIYNALRGIDNLPEDTKTAAEITQAALEKTCPVCEETLDLFCHFLGIVTGNLALSLGAKGGIYIAGGIVPKLGDYFKNSRFFESYFSHGRFNDYLKSIPVYVITRENLAFEGLRDFN